MRAAQALAQNEQACKARVGKALVSANEWRRAYEEAAQQAQTLKCERDEVAEENAELAKTCKKLEADKARYISSLAFLTEICDDLNPAPAQQALKRERDEEADGWKTKIAKLCKKLEADKARATSRLAGFLTEICADLNVKL
ncbi:hypothetical protein DIPPA_27633 [Diplonema papillatum]|nr:hypothetical protein DIPPA_27633 [Diplonema papillatum]